MSLRLSDSSLLPEPVGQAVRVSHGFVVGRFAAPVGLALAPMAGITDVPFRALCRSLGAEYTVAEMTSAQPHLRNSRKSQNRTRIDPAESPRVIQIVGGDADALAAAARYNVEQGADIIDINMGCPAKKVCKREAGAALLADERNVARILNAVTRAVNVPVTLKYRTGLTANAINAVAIARIAEQAGIALLTLHGRTRTTTYRIPAEYATIRAVKAAVTIPVLANGDIDSAEKALEVLAQTGADGVMIGRAAFGRPWLFAEMKAALTGAEPTILTAAEKQAVVLRHINALEDFYGTTDGIVYARKQLLAYAMRYSDSVNEAWRKQLIQAEDYRTQRRLVGELFEQGAGASGRARLH